METVEIRDMMPTIICENALDAVRKNPWCLGDWYEGRARAAALIHPTLHNIGAANEINFLNGDYARRHFK